MLGLPELMILMLALLLLFGPSRLPKLARGIGESIRGFRKELDKVSPRGEDPGGKGSRDLTQVR